MFVSETKKKIKSSLTAPVDPCSAFTYNNSFFVMVNDEKKLANGNVFKIPLLIHAQPFTVVSSI